MLKAKDIYEIAMKVSSQSVKFKTSFLVGNKIIQSEDVKEEFMTLASLNKIKDFKERLINAMEIKPYKQITFTDMDIIYDIRGPFFASTDSKLFEAYILKMGEDYSKNDIKYVEVAASSKMFKMFDSKAYEKKHKIIGSSLKKAKEKYDVDINLLIANPRSKTNEEDINQYLSIVAKCIKYPYIRGIDLLGHEKTSNKLYNYTFASVTRMCALHDLKYFTIRSHAGETRENTNNVKDFLIGIKKELEYMKENEEIDKAYIPDIRIGHGVYGIDEEAITLMKELDAKVEINASSNLALNNIYDLKQIPVRKYIDNGIEIVLGTDGQGIYLNSNKQESLIACALGVSEEELRQIKEFEEDYVMKKDAEIEKRKSIDLLKKDDYLSQIFKVISKQKNDININLQEVEDMLDNKKICFICGMEKREEKDIEIIKEDLQRIVNRVIKEKQSILIYDNGAYINKVLENICDKCNIELIKITSQDEKEEGLIYGKDKYEVSKNLSKYFSNKNNDIYVIGGSLFASDLLVNLENEGVKVIYESRIEGAGKEYEERRNNKERENKEGLLETRGRKK